MMPTPAMPHIVEVVTVDAERAGRRFTARRGAQRRHIVAGDRLLGRRDQRLHFLVVVRRDAVDGLRIEGDLPAARRRAGELDVLGRRRAGIGDDDRHRGFLAGRRRGVETRPSRPLMSSFGWPVMSRPRSVVAEASSAATRAVTLYLPAATVFGGVTLSLTSLDWPGSTGTALSSWLPYCSVKVASKFCGAWADERDGQLLAAVVLDAELILEARFQVAAQFGKLRRHRELGRQILGQRDRDRQSRLVALPAAATVSVCVPIGASFGTSSRS